MIDNPSPEMLRARAEVRQRVEDTYENSAEAFKKITLAYDNIGSSTTRLGTQDREDLYKKLAAAQAEYQLCREDHSRALAAYHEYFQPIEDTDGGV